MVDKTGKFNIPKADFQKFPRFNSAVVQNTSPSSISFYCLKLCHAKILSPEKFLRKKLKLFGNLSEFYCRKIDRNNIKKELNPCSERFAEIVVCIGFEEHKIQLFEVF